MTLIHRDYHPQNTLWSRLRLTGVVDWTQASRGPPALDLGHMRWNLVADYGQGVADRFLACYRAATGAAPGDQPTGISWPSSTCSSTAMARATSSQATCASSRITPQPCSGNGTERPWPPGPVPGTSADCEQLARRLPALITNNVLVSDRA
jgi:hypothetical protein